MSKKSQAAKKRNNKSKPPAAPASGKQPENRQRGSKPVTSKVQPAENKARGSKAPPAPPKKNGPPKKKRNIFQRALRKIRLFSISLYKSASGNKNRMKAISITAGGVILALVLSLSIYNGVKKNAYAITIGENSVAIIKMGKEDVTEELEKQAILKIENSLGSRVLVNERVVYTPVHASKGDMVSSDEAILKISSYLTYKVEAACISVEGTKMATLKSQKDAEAVLEAIMEPYLMDGVRIVEKGFVEDVRIESVYVEADELDDIDKALRVLTTTMQTAEDYTVVSGDTLGIIASKADMTIDAVLALNPNIAINTVLQIGDTLNLTVDKPLISVRTVEELSYIDVEPKPIEYRQNPNERTSYQKTLQYGSVGQAEVTQHIIRINGRETETLDVERNITLQPTPEIIEVGTK